VKGLWLVIAATHATVAGAGYYFAPKEILDDESIDAGFFQVDTTKVLSATVESLRAENSLVVWSYRGTATVNATRTSWWVFEGQHNLIVPYALDYRLDLSGLTPDKVAFNEKAKIVTVRLPKLSLSNIAFQPERSTEINRGSLTYDDDTVHELGKLAYGAARKAAAKQAQQPAMIEVAKQHAREAVQSYFEIPLGISGRPEVRVGMYEDKGAYHLYLFATQAPIACLKPTGTGDEVRIAYWSHRRKWEDIDDMGGCVLPLDQALSVCAEIKLSGISWLS